MGDYEWTDVGSINEIPRKGSRTIKTPRGDVALFRTAADEVFALRDRCPHKNGPLSQGIVHGKSVTCPLHGWVISLESGEAQGADKGCTPKIPVQVQNGRISIKYQPVPMQAAE
jgi:nitrite reductase (NADH) small subunit